MKATYTLNTEKNGIEIRFDAKPAAEVLESIKAAGYRWSRGRRLWWAKQSPKALETAQAIAEGLEIPSATASKSKHPEDTPEDKVHQAALMERYRAELDRIWDPKMVDFCAKKAARIVELEGGYITEIDKPGSETSFCFGYSLSRYDAEDYARANNAASSAAKDQQYFIRENMENIKRTLRALTDDRLRVYRRLHYWTSPADSQLVGIEYLRAWEDPRDGWQEIAPADREKLAEAWRAVGRQFLKRLRSYLKRYGMSKIETWNYWRDE